MAIKRYKLIYCFLDEDPDGELVAYSDIAQLESQLDTAKAEIETYKDALAIKFNAEMCVALEPLREKLTTAKAENVKLRELLESRCVPSGTPPIVCLCGSTRFMDAFFEAGWKFTLEGKIVLSVGVCKHAEHHGGEAIGQDIADKLDELHFRKIDLADAVFVLNVRGYIGDSTRKEIEYAESLHKPISYLEPSEGGA